jgi:site-specific recombinase XerD
MGRLSATGQPELGLRPRLLDRVRDSLRRRRYSLRTEKVYLHWIRRFILFNGKRHPQEMGADEVTAFLSHLARTGRVSASTQNQALSALLYLYRQVLSVRLPWLDGVERAKTVRRIPTVLTVEQVQSVLTRLEGSRWLMVSLMYGAGLRLMECLSLR